MTKILILTSHSQSLTSVEVICKDLLLIYESLKDSFTNLVIFDVNNNDFLNFDFPENEKVIFACIHPGVIRSETFLRVTKKMRSDDKLLIHVYGDFLRQIPFFYEAQKHLTNKKVLFLPPSKTYGNLLGKFITSSESIRTMPFPVEINPCCKPHIPSKEIVFVYAGRISRQKNVELLIEWFSKLSPKENYKLFIIGRFDDFEVANIGQNLALGELYQRLQKHESESIVFIDHLSHEELFNYYKIADYFVSFSTYHDEDFGRAPVEALLCGTQCLLSDWGGFRDILNEFPLLTTPITVKLTSNGLDMTVDKKFKPQKKTIKFDDSMVVSKFSKNKFKSSLEKIISAEFPLYQSPYPLLQELAEKSRSFFYNTEGELIVENYRKIYQGFGTDL